MGGVARIINKVPVVAGMNAIRNRAMGQAGNAVGWNPYAVNGSAFAPDAGEKGLIHALQARAYGQAPSAAEMQMHRGLDQGVAQSNAMAASARGIEPALAARMALTNQAGMAQDVNSQGAILRAEEQAQAQNSLANELQSVRTGRMQEQGLRAGVYDSGMNRRQNIVQGVGQMFQGAAMMADGGEIQPDTIHTMSAPDFLSAIRPGSQLKDMSGGKGGGMGGAKKMIGMTSGGRVMGNAESHGDSPSNDTVPAMLSPGEIVIPRSVAQNPNAPDMAREFVAQIKRQKEMKGSSKDGPSYAKVLALHRDMGEVIKRLASKQSQGKGA